MAFSRTINSVTSNQTISATFGVGMVNVNFVFAIGPVVNATSVLPSTMTFKYSTNGSTWSTIYLYRADWTLGSGALYYQTKTITITSGSSLYFKVGTIPSIVNTVGAKTFTGSTVYITTSSTSLGNPTADWYCNVGVTLSHLTLDVTSGDNGTVSFTYVKNTTTYNGSVSNDSAQVEVDYGSDITYAVTPDENYEIDELTVNGVDPR